MTPPRPQVVAGISRVPGNGRDTLDHDTPIGIEELLPGTQHPGAPIPTSRNLTTYKAILIDLHTSTIRYSIGETPTTRQNTHPEPMASFSDCAAGGGPYPVITGTSRTQSVWLPRRGTTNQSKKKARPKATNTPIENNQVVLPPPPNLESWALFVPKKPPHPTDANHWLVTIQPGRPTRQCGSSDREHGFGLTPRVCFQWCHPTRMSMNLFRSLSD